MTAVIRANGLSKAYRRRRALSDCTLDIPAGKVTGLVGPNGAGKTTFLSLAVGMLKPSAGTVEVCGGTPASSAEQLSKVGFVAQNTPTYSGFTVEDHLRLGAHLNVRWDAQMARSRMADLGLDPKQRASQLSGGQRAQLALTIGLAKRPELLVLDEPVASLDPLARREFLQTLMGAAAEHELSVVLSSHVVSDLERVCDHIIVLVDSRVRVEGDVSDLLEDHARLVGTRRDPHSLPSDQQVITESHTDRQSTFVVRTSQPVLDPGWRVNRLDLEDLVLAYMQQTSPSDGRPSRLEVVG